MFTLFQRRDAPAKHEYLSRNYPSSAGTPNGFGQPSFYKRARHLWLRYARFMESVVQVTHI